MQVLGIGAVRSGCPEDEERAWEKVFFSLKELLAAFIRVCGYSTHKGFTGNVESALRILRQAHL